MKLAIINFDPSIQFDENSLGKALGGSETWAVELSNALQKQNQEVTVFCSCTSHTASNGVEYRNIDELIPSFEHDKFDAIIASRFIYDIVDQVDKFKPTKNIYIQAHDDTIMINSPLSFYNPLVKTIVSLSQWHRMYLAMPHSLNPVPLQKIAVIPNGITPSHFEIDEPSERDNNLLWSSAPTRGLNILTDFILPKVKEKYKDCTVNVCGYNENLNLIDNAQEKIQNGSIRILGNLSKKELYTEMKKHKCWFYPQTFHETFCITAIEQAICGANLIMPLQNGPAHIFAPFKNNIGMHAYFDRDIPQFYGAINEAADRICDSFENYEKNAEIRQNIKDYLLLNYTWDRVASMWINLIKQTKE